MILNKRPAIRLLAFALSVLMLVMGVPTAVIAEGLISVTADSAENPDKASGKVSILYHGAAEKTVYVAENGKEILTSKVEGITTKSRAWQLLDPVSYEWITVYGRSGDSLPVTYALVGSMLNESGRAYIRLRVSDGSSYYVSETLEIVITENVSEALLANDTFTGELSDAPVFASSADDELGTHSIVIRYLFDNGGIAFEPYGATVAKGSDFSATVTSPTVVGYHPVMRVGETYEDASTVVLNYTNIQADITVNVIYEPAVVDFQIHHHYQDLYSDEYSLQPDRITYGKGMTGSTVPDGLALTEDELPGFKALAYEKMTVAADGSTVIEIRYDRNYYLVNFDMQGGFGTEPIYTRYGSTVGANSPTRPGYLFDGWELYTYAGKAPTAEQKATCDINGKTIVLPNANLVYRARWITQLTTYTMVFWKENINDNGFSYWGYLDGLSAMSGSYVSGANRVQEAENADTADVNYFTYCDALTDHDVLVEGDGSTVVNVYYTRNRYSITFKATGRCTIPENHVHTEDCYLAFCKGGHEHADECGGRLVCTVTEHTAHTADCFLCGYTEEHTHSASCCQYTQHTHTKNCYRNIGNTANPSGAPSGVVSGYIYGVSSGWRTTYYICISGTWYRYNGSGVQTGSIVDATCGNTEHTHGTVSCSCPLTAHTHSDACFRDTLHTHKDSCYSYSCGLSSHIHSDGCFLLNCGIPTGHTHTSTCRSASSTNTVKIVYKKYQQNLGKDPDNFLTNSDNGIWPIVDDNGVVYDSGERWSPSGSSTYSQVLVYIANMPGENFTLTLSTSNNDTYTMNYYLEVLPSYTGEVVKYGGKRYILYTTVKANYNYLTKAEDFFDIKGFEKEASNPTFGSNGQIDINGGGVVDMYYSRQVDHTLTFQSNGVVLIDKNVYGIQYGESLKSYEFTPDYPAALEPNAYYFAGWYTSPGHYDGTEVNWDTITMEAGGVMLYAKWAPITHTVKVYLDDSLGEQIGDVQYVGHGNFAYAPESAVTNGNYIFQGWFYKDTVNGETVEKAFEFTGIPVMKDLVIYAKWSSHVTVNYKINYVLYTTKEPIATPTEGSAIAGNNKTFYAKAGDELFGGYQSGYYPLTNSHTVTMSAESDHEFTFEYVYVESMPYAVRYVDENGTELAEIKRVFDNNLSVVTETFIRFDRKMPDAYQKRLILSAAGDDADSDGILDNNVITFYYTSDSEHAYYRVVHYIQNLAADGYREYRSEEAVGVIGNSYTVQSVSLTGFTLNGALTRVNGASAPINSGELSAELGADGFLVEFYYDRNPVSYTVNYLESGTNTVVYPQKTVTGKFGEQIVEYAPTLTALGYSLVGNDVRELNLSMNTELNVINFYYQENTVSLKYQIVGLPGAGTLSFTSENVPAATGIPAGSLPTVANGFHFVGWYLDEACTYPVEESWVDAETHAIKPVSDGPWQKDHTYYAKIDPDFTTLTLKTEGAVAIDGEQAFIFRIQGVSADTAGVDLTVCVVGNASVTVENLRIGAYTVTELTSWSYRYTPDGGQKTLELSVNASENVMTFSHIRAEDKWLDHNDAK